jgi:hypothetical protein
VEERQVDVKHRRHPWGASRLRRASKDADEIGAWRSSFEARKSAHLRMTKRTLSTHSANLFGTT